MNPLTIPVGQMLSSRPSTEPNVLISEISSKLQELQMKQTNLEEKFRNLDEELLKKDSVEQYEKQIEEFQPLLNSIDSLKELKEKYLAEDVEMEEKLKVFRLLLGRFFCDKNQWKYLAHCFYRLKAFLAKLEHYQIRIFLQSHFQMIFNGFISLMKDLITDQIRAEEKLPRNKSNDQSIENLRNQLSDFKGIILSVPQHFQICQVDRDAMNELLQIVDDIRIEKTQFDQNDQNEIRLFKLREDLETKSNRSDLRQLKTYFDHQMKKLIELNQRNAKKLDQLKLMKSATCETRQVQNLLERSSSEMKKEKYSNQSSRPYIVFELDLIRQYQRQALIRSSYGTIPLYRRQTWIEANLFSGRPLHFIRHMQKTLHQQIHDLLGYHPADRHFPCDVNRTKNKKKKKKKIDATSDCKQILTERHDIAIMGNDKKLYRGQISTCQTRATKISTKQRTKRKSLVNETMETQKMPLDQFDPTIQTVGDENLFQYFDWFNQFNDQDLPDELCEELFQHWKSVVCKDQPCSYDEISDEQNLHQTVSSSSNSSFNAEETPRVRCICSDCSCSCEKNHDDQSEASICLCSQCSCQCLKESLEKDDEEIENHRSDDEEKSIPHSSESLKDLNQEVSNLLPETFEIDEIPISDCFTNQPDRWTEQFTLFPIADRTSDRADWSIVDEIPSNYSQFQSSAPIVFVRNRRPPEKFSDHLDDPTTFREELLSRHPRN